MDLLLEKFDAVVMLTWSNWKTELRSNRYHYATRFSQFFPVIFVQPDLYARTFRYENTEFDNIFILHISQNFRNPQSRLLSLALNQKKISKPLLWVYNCGFYRCLAQVYSPLVVYHATEDYFTDSPHQFKPESDIFRELQLSLKNTDLLVSVSEGVEQAFIRSGNYNGDHVVVTNGCDFKFYADHLPASNNLRSNIVLYQGNINLKLDFTLLAQLVSTLPDYEFWFAGKISDCEKDWKKLKRFPNVKYLGLLNCDQLKVKMYEASVGIVPFKHEDYLKKSSFPLKIFEYLSCGLPVVSTPIDSLEEYSHLIYFADDFTSFAENIRKSCEKRHDQEQIKLRISEARKQDYDLKFTQMVNAIENRLKKLKRNNSMSKLKILFLYDANSMHVKTILEHLHAFENYSRHAVYYASGTLFAKCDIDLSVFDVVVIHYSIRINTTDTTSSLSASYKEAIKNFGGYKIAFIQDEYDTTNIAKAHFLELGIHCIYTNVPKEFIELVYPAAEFKHVDFITTLTGFVPESLYSLSNIKPLQERKIAIGYRGRDLPYWYGDLGREKFFIGVLMKKICEERNVPCDIEWEGDKRIYGDGWYEFLSSCRATLGTESGSNVFDFDGQVSHNIKEALAANPEISYEEIRDKYLSEHEGKIHMNQISPKIFESIALRTALILFEGSYSNVVKPGLHFIELKKDFSNIDDVLQKLNDDDYLNAMTQRAYDDIVKSELYSYKNFVAQFDDDLARKIKTPNPIKIFPVLYACANTAELSTSNKQVLQCNSVLSTEIFSRFPSLHLINTLGQQPLENTSFRKLMSHYFNRTLANEFLIETALKLNRIIPGKPFSKVYRVVNKLIK